MSSSPTFPRSESPPSPHKGARILVVDDEENVRLSLAVILQKRGYSVETASGGREAVAKLQVEPFDLVLTDLAMKDLDGIEVLAAVQREQPDTVAIMLTGFASLDTAIEAIRRGAYDYLAKPANVEDMLQTIERGLEKRRLVGELRRQNAELDALNRLAHVGVGRVLQSTRDLGRALGEVLDIVTTIFAPLGAAALFGRNLPEGTRLVRSGTDRAEQLVQSGAALRAAEAACQAGEEVRSSPELPAILAVPLETPAGRLGALVVLDVEPRPWSEDKIQTARTIAGRIATAIENAALYREIDEEREAASRILHAAGDGIVGLDGAGRILFYSRAASRLTGRVEDDVRGRPFAELLSPSPGPEALAELLEDARGAANGLVSGEIFLRSGSEDVACDVLCASSRSTRPEAPLQWVLSLRDARERRRAEEERGNAFSHLTHELKTPLTSILAYADLLGRGTFGELTEGQQGALAIVRRNGRQLELLIENMLGLARIRRGTLEYRFERVPLSQLVEDARNVFASIAAERGVDLRIEGTLDLEVEADRRMLEMAINNLLFNAFKYTDRGGHVTLRLVAEGGHVGIEVADTGVGIPEEYLDRIFEAHFQSDRTRGGSGLGLAIVRSVAEAHGGSIEVESRPGQGSRFVFRLASDRGSSGIPMGGITGSS